MTADSSAPTRSRRPDQDGRPRDLRRPSAPEPLPHPVVDNHCHLDISDGDGWLEVAEYPPVGRIKEGAHEDEKGDAEEAPVRDVKVIRAEPEGVSADDYFRFMGSLPAPHILEFLNGYCERDGLSPDAVREALRIASERDARRVGYVRSILERWVERGVKTVEDVARFEQDRKLRLVEQSGAVRGGALRIRETREGVSGGPDRQSAARRREGYEWLFGETE